MSTTSHELRTTIEEFLSRRVVLSLLTVVPVLVLFLFVNILPILYTVVSSFYRIPLFNPEWTWVGVEQYRRVLTDSAFWASVRRSIVFAGGSVIIQVALGGSLALVLNREFKFNRLVRAIGFLPYMVPAAVLGYIAIWMGDNNFGVINLLLLEAEIISSPITWFGSPDFAMPSIIVASSWKFMIFVTILVLARLQSIPDDLYEAAYVAGASQYQRFRDITLPNLKNVLFIVILLRGMWMVNKFDFIYVTTRGGPGDTTTTVPIYAYQTAFDVQRLGEAAAVSTVLFVMVGTVAFLYFKFLNPEDEVRVE